MSERTLFTPCPNGIDPVLQEAFDIALDYLEFTGQAFPLMATQEECGRVIVDEWVRGKKHRIWLANKAIEAIERKQRPIVTTGPIITIGPVRRL